MKLFNAIIKIAVALAAVAGVVYVIATYGEQIVAWSKRVWARLEACHGCNCDCDDCDCDDCECDMHGDESVAEEAPAQEAPADETVVVADETDFEG